MYHLISFLNVANKSHILLVSKIKFLFFECTRLLNHAFRFQCDLQTEIKESILRLIEAVTY